MTTAIRDGSAATLKWGGTAIVQVIEYDSPNRTIPSIKTSYLGLTHHTYRPGTPDGGDFTATIWYDPSDTTHQGLEADAETPVTRAVILTYDGYTDSFSAFLTGFHKTGFVLDGNIQAEIKGKVTGGIVTAVVSS